MFKTYKPGQGLSIVFQALSLLQIVSAKWAISEVSYALCLCVITSLHAKLFI